MNAHRGFGKRDNGVDTGRLYDNENPQSFEKRDEEREGAYRHVVVEFHNGDSLNCLARDISDKGCRITADGVCNLPDNISICMAIGGAGRAARIAWRDGNDVGVEFVDPA